MQVPASLKAITPYLKHAAQVARADPLLAYYCRFYAVQKGIQVRSTNPDEENKRFLVGLMDSLANEKIPLANQLALDTEEQSEYVQKIAFRAFLMADNEDRAGQATRNTAKYALFFWTM